MVKKSILYYKKIIVIVVTDFVCPMGLQLLMPSLLVVVKCRFWDKLHSMTPPKTLFGKRVHSMTPPQNSLKKFHKFALNDPDPQKKKSLKHPLLKKKKIEKQFKEI